MSEEKPARAKLISLLSAMRENFGEQVLIGVDWQDDLVLASCTVEACAKCGDSYCEPCPKCGACKNCDCEPDIGTAISDGTNCESCGTPIHTGDQIYLYADDIETHVECPSWAVKAQA